LTAAKKLLSRLGSDHRERVLELLRTAERLVSRLEIVLGFIEIHEAKSGLVTFSFELWNRRARFTPAELQAEAAAFDRMISEFSRHFERVARELIPAGKSG
jgi:hypothetical protein